MSEEIEIRKVQAYSGERSLTIVLPKVFSEKLRIEKGDFLKVYLEGGKLIVEKAAL
jgi:bifunctional DNA-binding transcriptional regulator/antitoxin component of YhaV-PrlF toxin-antitoxin module